MNLFPWLALLGLVIWLVDRILLWCELRGWISYRRSPRVRHAYGDSLLGIDALLQPSRRHVIELKQELEVHTEEDDEGGGDDQRRIATDGDPDCAARNSDRTADRRGTQRTDMPAAFRQE